MLYFGVNLLKKHLGRRRSFCLQNLELAGGKYTCNMQLTSHTSLSFSFKPPTYRNTNSTTDVFLWVKHADKMVSAQEVSSI